VSHAAAIQLADDAVARGAVAGQLAQGLDACGELRGQPVGAAIGGIDVRRRARVVRTQPGRQRAEPRRLAGSVRVADVRHARTTARRAPARGEARFR
jgi:hypothetical protein